MASVADTMPDFAMKFDWFASYVKRHDDRTRVCPGVYTRILDKKRTTLHTIETTWPEYGRWATSALVDARESALSQATEALKGLITERPEEYERLLEEMDGEKPRIDMDDLRIRPCTMEQHRQIHYRNLAIYHSFLTDRDWAHVIPIVSAHSVESCHIPI
jgi:hypothetical protein